LGNKQTMELEKRVGYLTKHGTGKKGWIFKKTRNWKIWLGIKQNIELEKRVALVLRSLLTSVY